MFESTIFGIPSGLFALVILLLVGIFALVIRAFVIKRKPEPIQPAPQPMVATTQSELSEEELAVLMAAVYWLMAVEEPGLPYRIANITRVGSGAAWKNAGNFANTSLW